MASNKNQEIGSIRLDAWVREQFPSLTKRQSEEAFERALVCRKGGKPLQKGMKLGHDLPDVSRLRAHLALLSGGNKNLTIPIVDEKEGIWIIDKPAGVASQPISLFDSDTVTHWALSNFPQIKREFLEIQPVITPHRLDRGTSGLMIVAKNRTFFHYWREQFHQKKVHKKYLAWCWGNPRQSFYDVDLSLAHHPKSKRKMVPISERYSPPVLPARSFVRVLEKSEGQGMFLCEVSCQTGVTHQVRVHLAFLGFPLVGDTLYDAFAGDRAVLPKFHKLRAIEIRAGENQWQLNTADYLNDNRFC